MNPIDAHIYNGELANTKADITPAQERRHDESYHRIDLLENHVYTKFRDWFAENVHPRPVENLFNAKREKQWLDAVTSSFDIIADWEMILDGGDYDNDVDIALTEYRKDLLRIAGGQQ